MSQLILKSDIVLDDNRFLQLGFDGAFLETFSERADFNVTKAVELLMADQGLAASFLYKTSGNGKIYWAGDGSLASKDGKSFGVKVISRKTGTEVVGDNTFGRFLSSVREALVELLSEEVVREDSILPGQVITDFTRKGAYRSDIEERELVGERFIHVDHYIPAKFRRDAFRDGTTGHASRLPEGEGAAWQRFECPFGVAYPSAIIVESEAEAAFLFERALRGDLDWNALFCNLRDRGLLRKGISDKQIVGMASEYWSQFEWMREQIATNRELRGLPIVAPSLLCRDSSYGRSSFDSVYAPSAAHVLARYINNPMLLFSKSDYCTLSALDNKEKNEPVRLSVGGGESVNVLVIGSDTIGGRENGRRATSSLVKSEHLDAQGRRIITTRKKFDLPMKPKEEVEADYEAFANRMDSILSGVSAGTRVRFVTGNSSMVSPSVGVGTPRMLERYVKSKGGDVLQWNYNSSSPSVKLNGKDGSNVEVVLMDNLADVLPVLGGVSPKVTFLRDENDPDSEVSFSSDPGLSPQAVLCFSVKDDLNINNILSEASLFGSRNIPVIHSQENRTEEQQREELSAGAVLSRSALAGEILERGTLFAGEVPAKWELNDGNMLSFIDSESGMAIPFVSNIYPSPVLVSGQPFRSVLGAYAALCAVSCGDASKSVLSSIAASESSLERVMVYVSRYSVDDETQENLLRRSIRLMSAANEPFSRRLLELDSKPVVMPYTGDDPARLFVDLDGNGQNRFGMVLTDEISRMKEFLEARRLSEENEREQAVREANKRQKLAVAAKAEAQLVAGGLPSDVSQTRDAVWFLGTHRPLEYSLREGSHSFELWDDLLGSDPLVREKAMRSWVDDGDGGRIDNDFVFLFPSDLSAVTGRRRVANKADSRDLTGVIRKDPKTGVDFICAFGVPVRMNNRGNELLNDDNLPCSYRLDNEASHYAESLVLADSGARSTAIRHGMTLCVPGRVREDGTVYYSLGQVFMNKVYDRKEGRMVDNPHAAPLNAVLTSRYLKLLESGANYPLNCVPLPSADYGGDDAPGPDWSSLAGVTPESRFLSDLLLSLRIANSTALALGVPLRIPLDKDGKIDLGPGVPENMRELAQHKIESFIGVSSDIDLSVAQGQFLERIPASEAARQRDRMTKSGEDIYVRPNDLVGAFGRFDFSYILSGQTAPLHEMHFRMEDGTVVSIVDSKLTRGMSLGEINEYLRYEKNDERRFVIRSTDPEKIPVFIASLKASVARSKSLSVETRLVSESESKNQSLEGYVKLLQSNDLEFAEDENTIGAERTIFNGTNRFDSFDAEQVYWGREDARDGFKGYAQMRCTYPDGSSTDWITVTDLELAKDIVMSTVHRKYKSDNYSVPANHILELFVKGEMLKNADVRSKVMDFSVNPVAESRKEDKIVVLEPSSEDMEPVKPVTEAEQNSEQEMVNDGKAVSDKSEIEFTVSEGGYSKRTWENANADGVDFTVAFGVSFDTYGERCTARAAGDSLIEVFLPVKKSGGLDLSAKAVKAVSEFIADSLPDEFLNGEPVGLNIAGNGLYTLASRGITQEQCDEFVVKVLSYLQTKGVVVSCVRSGGQTGIDEAGAAAARVLDIPAIVHGPKGWQMRLADGKDVYGEDRFKERFASKDYDSLASCLEQQQVKSNNLKM